MIDNALKIEGWMTATELELLAFWATSSKIIIEVGSYLGRSTMVLADNCLGKVISVDPYSGPYYFGDNSEMIKFDDSTMMEFHKNLKDHLISGKLVHLRDTLPNLRSTFNPDLIFLDGDHREQPLRDDIKAAQRLMKHGILAGHDYGHTSWPVKEVVDELFPKAQIKDSIWWIEQ